MFRLLFVCSQKSKYCIHSRTSPENTARDHPHTSLSLKSLASKFPQRSLERQMDALNASVVTHLLGGITRCCPGHDNVSKTKFMQLIFCTYDYTLTEGFMCFLRRFFVGASSPTISSSSFSFSPRVVTARNGTHTGLGEDTNLYSDVTSTYIFAFFVHAATFQNSTQIQYTALASARCICLHEFNRRHHRTESTIHTLRKSDLSAWRPRIRYSKSSRRLTMWVISCCMQLRVCGRKITIKSECAF